MNQKTTSKQPTGFTFWGKPHPAGNAFKRIGTLKRFQLPTEKNNKQDKKNETKNPNK